MIVRTIPLADIDTAPLNRPPAAIEALAGSIGRNGLLQPLVVRELPGGRYQLIAGHRRLAAVRLLAWPAVPCAVVESTEDDLLRAVENVGRLQLTFAELCESVAQLLGRYQPRELAASLGYSVTHVRNLARVKENLCPEAWAVLQAEGHKARHEYWFEMAGRPAFVQKARLFSSPAPSAANHTDAKRRPTRKQIEAARKGLPDTDPRALALDWVLGRKEALAG